MLMHFDIMVARYAEVRSHDAREKRRDEATPLMTFGPPPPRDEMQVI